jgi:hypothetical protein
VQKENKEKGDEKMTNKRKNVEQDEVMWLLPLVALVLLATVAFWGTFTLTVIIINAIPIYGLGSCVPAVFSAFITGLVLYLVKESAEK